MIVYNPKRWNGLIVIVPPGCFHGSPMFAAFIFGLAGAAIAIAVKLAPSQLGLGEDVREESLLDHPAPMMVFGSVVTFLVAFRANLAYSRFWEARTALQRMSSSWADVGTMTIAFDENAKDLADYKEWKEDFVHLLSLLHALAILCLRCDQDLANLVEHKSFSHDAEGDAAWETEDDEASHRPRSRTNSGELRRSDRPVMAKSAVKNVTKRSGVEARDAYKPRQRSINAAAIVSGKTPKKAVVPTKSNPLTARTKARGLSAFRAAGLAVMATGQRAKRPQEEAGERTEESQPAEAKVQHTADAVADVSETALADVSETAERELGAAEEPAGGPEQQLLPGAVEESADRTPAVTLEPVEKTPSVTLPGESEAGDDDEDAFDVTPSSTDSQGPPGFAKKREVRRRSVTNMPAADVVAVHDLAEKHNRGSAVKSFRQPPKAKSFKDIGLRVKFGAKLQMGMSQNSKDLEAASAGTSPSDQGRKSPSPDVTSPATDRFVAVEISNTILKRLENNALRPLMVVGGLQPSEREALEGGDTLHGERTYIAYMWVYRAVVERVQKRGLRQGPPSIAGIYRSLSAGMDAFQQCKKVVDTPFPWPYAQCVMVALILFTVTFPIQCCEVINNPVVAPIVSFFGVFLIAMVNVVATELEEPFMDDANDIPLADLHVDFNEKVWTLVQPRYWRTRWPHKLADGKDTDPIVPLPEMMEDE